MREAAAPALIEVRVGCLDDNDVVALVEGKLPPDRLREVEAHLDGCSACRQLAAASAKNSASLEGAAAEGAQQLGRYSVLKPIGAGAMGIVYAAYDPVLDRRVALKLLHASGGDSARLRTRLLREAQAMARLSHPNVIAVHDVGTVNDQVFVAMEFVEGCTLTQWIARKHPWREVLRVFVLAGRGLAAAHAAGLVHRDFKPDNVLIGDDGRVRVTDFGLARAEVKIDAAQGFGPDFISGFASAAPALSKKADSSSGEGGAARGEGVAARSMSEQGALVGSPAYMAPEQLRGEPVDARADEFSFSVALYESIYGERPFVGDNLSELKASIAEGRLRPEPPGVRLPGWVRRVLTRGLASRPADRFPTLDALLDALEADPAASRRRWIVAIATISLLLGGALFARWEIGRSARACGGADAKVQTVFSAQLRQQSQAAFVATKLPYAQAAWTLAERSLDRYATEWAQVRVDACEATAVRHEQSSELLDLRIDCLDERLRELTAVMQLFAHADAAVVEKAGEVVSGLSPLAACADARALREPSAVPKAIKARVDEVSGKLAELHTRANAGKIDLPALRAQVEAARQLGHAPLLAAALLNLGELQSQSGDPKSARDTMAQAAAEGMRARSDSIVADAWTGMIDIDLELNRVSFADEDVLLARAAVARLPENRLSQAALLRALSQYDRMSNRLTDAEADARSAVALLEKDQEHSHDTIAALGELGLSLAAAGRMADALAVDQRAYDLASQTVGPEHPLTGELEAEVGSMQNQLGHDAEAKVHLEHGLSVLVNALGNNHPAVADVLTGLAELEIKTAPKQAIAHIQWVQRINKDLPENDNKVFAALMLGDALHADGQFAAAKIQLEETLKMAQRVSSDPDDIQAALARCSLGELFVDMNQLKPAREMLEAALAVQLKTTGGDNSVFAETAYALAKLDLREQRYAEAIRLGEQALAAARDQDPDSDDAKERAAFLSKARKAARP